MLIYFGKNIFDNRIVIKTQRKSPMARYGDYGREQKVPQEGRLGVTPSKLKLKEYKRSQGLNCAKNAKHEEAIEYLSGIEKDKEVKRALCMCHYKMGQQKASKNLWGIAKKHFGSAEQLGWSNRIINDRLRLLSQLIKTTGGAEKPQPVSNEGESYLEMGRRTGGIATPGIEISRYRPLVDEVYCVGVYKWSGDPLASDKWSKLLRALKERKCGEAIRVLGATLTEFTAEETNLRETLDFIVPVPADPGRLAERGYNIPTLLCEQMSRRTSIPMFKDILTKKDTTEKRASYTKLCCVLEVKKPSYCKGRHVLIVDDITTHGHTFRACARRLKEAGTEKVSAMALAHSEPTSIW